MKSLYKECLSLNVETDSEQAMYVFAESVLYLLGANGAFDYQRRIKPFCVNRSAKNFRLMLREHRYSNLNIKLYLIGISMNCQNVRQAQSHAAQYEITKRDAKLIWLLYTTNAWFKRLVVKHVCNMQYRSEDLSYDALHQTFNRVYPSVYKYIKHITYTKLRFLAKSTNSELSDYHSELSAKLVQSYYATAPTIMSDAHLTNYLKRSVHHHAINLIKGGTTLKRSRMLGEQAANGEWKFSMQCLSQNQMSPNELGEQPDVDGSDSSADTFELRFSISEVLDNFCSTSRKYKFLTLLLGAEDSEFSGWLRSSGRCNLNEDNVDVQQRTSASEYTKLVAGFLNVPKYKVDSLFESLKHKLAWA